MVITRGCAVLRAIKRHTKAVCVCARRGVCCVPAIIVTPVNGLVRRPACVPPLRGVVFVVSLVYIVTLMALSLQRFIMSTNDKKKERFSVQLRLDADLFERLSIAMKEDGDDNRSGWIKRLLRRELDKRGIESKS